MKLLTALLALGQPTAPDCAAELILRGSGRVAAGQVAPYARCLNSTIGSQEQLRASCRGVRDRAADYRGPARIKAKVERAVGWLDAMIRERASCETVLKVEK